VEPNGPFANIVHREVIERLAGSTSFERGRRYFKEQRVTSLQRRRGGLFAQVRGSEMYAVKLWVHLGSLAYSCSCPQGRDKSFCKHAVATALAWLDDRSSEPILPLPVNEDDPVRAALRAKSKEALVELLVIAAKFDAALRTRILK
jgi:uncharacterized Zn finger protein